MGSPPGLGGKLDPEGRVHSAWALSASFATLAGFSEQQNPVLMRNTPLGGAGGFNKCGRRAEEFREAGGAHARICQGSAACPLHPMACFGPKIPSQPKVGGGEVVCRRGPAGAEGTQCAGGLQLPSPKGIGASARLLHLHFILLGCSRDRSVPEM